jgi:hypothetical protein
MRCCRHRAPAGASGAVPERHCTGAHGDIRSPAPIAALPTRRATRHFRARDARDSTLPASLRRAEGGSEDCGSPWHGWYALAPTAYR